MYFVFYPGQGYIQFENSQSSPILMSCAKCPPESTLGKPNVRDSQLFLYSQNNNHTILDNSQNFWTFSVLISGIPETFQHSAGCLYNRLIVIILLLYYYYNYIEWFRVFNFQRLVNEYWVVIDQYFKTSGTKAIKET